MTSWFAGALRFRLLILAAALGMVTIGLVNLRDAPVDVLPEFSPTYAEVQTEALGLSAEEVEQLITVPLEADLLNGVEGVDVIRSESLPGLSSIVMVFSSGTDVYRARQLVEERLTQAHALPNVSKPPTLLPPLSTSSRVLVIGMTTDQLTPIEQSVIARWTVRPRLMGVPGVANVSVWGMRDQQLQVLVDPETLRDRRVTLNQVVSTAGNAQVVSPLSFLEASTPGTGGFIETPQQRLQVRHLLEKIADPAELGRVPVDDSAGRLRLADVADIGVGHQPLIGDGIVAGAPGLVLVVEKFPGVSTSEVTAGVEAALETLRPGLSGVTTDTTVFRPASYVEDALGTLRLAALLAGGLFLLVLLALRVPWRAVIVAVVSVPLSLVTAGVVLQLMGQGFNALVLVGLAGAIAIVVDEAIAPTDRVVRRLRARRADGTPDAAAVAVRDGSAEARRPLVYATVIAVLLVVPVAVLQGRPGSFFAPMVLAYVVAVLAAVVVAITVAPALTLLLVSAWRPDVDREPAVSRVLGARYAAALARLERRRRAVLAAVGLAVVGLATIPFLDVTVVPTFEDRAVQVRLEGPPGTSNPRMVEITTALAAELEQVPGVETVAAHVGRAVTGDRVTNVNSSEVLVALSADADHPATMAAISESAGRVEGATSEVLTATEQQVRSVGAIVSGQESAGTGLDTLTGLDTPLTVRVFGQDPAVLAREATRVQEIVAGVDGVVDAVVDAPTTQSTLEIEVDLEKAQQHGLTPGAVRRAEAVLIQGIQVGSVFEEQRVFDVIVQGDPATRSGVAAVGELLIDRPDGGHVRLGEVADVRVAQTPSVISRDAVSRRIDVTAGVRARSIGDVAADVRTRLAATSFPMEYHAEVVTASTGSELGAGRFLGVAAAVLAAVFLVLQAAYGSWRRAGLAFVLVPLSLVGGLVAVALVGGELTLGSFLGLLAVLGLTVRSALLYADGLGDERLAPVLTSAAGLVALALPFALLGPRAGLELLQPLAVVLIGGVLTSAAVALLLLPALSRRGAPAEPGPEPMDRPVDGELPPQRVEQQVAGTGGWT